MDEDEARRMVAQLRRPLPNYIGVRARGRLEGERLEAAALIEAAMLTIDGLYDDIKYGGDRD